MKLVSSADRLYKSATSEIEEKYFISRDIIFLYFYFEKVDCEMLINGELFKGNIHDIETICHELQSELQKKKDSMSEKNRNIQYKTYIYTNNIIRASMLFKVDQENSELIYAKAGKHTKGNIIRIVMKNKPFILKNVQPLACNGLDNVNAEGVYKIKEILDFNCKISGQDLHHLGETIGRNIEKMEGVLIRNERKKDPKFLMPRLFSFDDMRKSKEGQVVRNYNLLQCANMAGLLQLDPDETFKVIPAVISFDIKAAYLSVLINQPIFPKNLTCIDIDPQQEHKDYRGRIHRTNPYEIASDLVKKLDNFERKSKWYYLAIDPNYFGDNPVVLHYLKILKPFRRNFVTHPDVKLKYVNQDQVVGFLLYDRKFYEDFYSIYMELTFEELIYNLLLLCPEAKIVLMYSKDTSTYLPKQFRDSKMELYKIKEAQSDGQLKNTSKLYTELTYGKGLQLHDFQSDSEVIKAVTNETVNIAMSLTCCSFTRYRIIRDWQGFTPLYIDSDSVKFRFSQYTNNFRKLVERVEELNAENSIRNILAGYPESNLGSWNVDGIYNYMLFLKKKCYIGYADDGTTELKIAGCDKQAAMQHFEGKTVDVLNEIEREQKLVIKGGMKKPNLLPNNEYEYYTPTDAIYQKKS